MAYVKGPWSLTAKRPGREKLIVIADPWPDDGKAQMACVAEIFPMSGPRGDSTGNGALIVAAPDMLEALRLALPQLVALGAKTAGAPAAKAAVEAAIAKAGDYK